jgi:hypothetical protein
MVALWICKELIVAVGYKLRMFGVEIDGPVNVFCDNRGVVKNVSIPELTLMKKHNAINYHVVREAVVAGIIKVGKEDGIMNLVDLLTKVVMGQKRWDFCYCLFILLSWSNSQVILVPVERDQRLYNMGQCMVECFTMTSCMFTKIQTT